MPSWEDEEEEVKKKMGYQRSTMLHIHVHASEIFSDVNWLVLFKVSLVFFSPILPLPPLLERTQHLHTTPGFLYILYVRGTVDFGYVYGHSCHSHLCFEGRCCRHISRVHCTSSSSIRHLHYYVGPSGVKGCSLPPHSLHLHPGEFSS